MAVGEVVRDSAPLEVVRVPMFETNYGWLLRESNSGLVAAVDPAEPGPIQQALEERLSPPRRAQ